MPVDFVTSILGNLSLPLLPNSGRSALQTLRRMMFVRWSAGGFLTALAKNEGFPRPDVGFSDDDFFRACVQAMVADGKSIQYIFESLLEIVIGPYEDQYYELDVDAKVDQGFLVYAPYGSYVPYDTWNTTPFVPGERIQAQHPVTGKKVIALLKEHNAAQKRIYYTTEMIEPEGGPFDGSMTITGMSSGGTVTGLGLVVNRDRYTFPLYADGYLDLGGPNEESVTFVAPDPFASRVRVVNDLTKKHLKGEKITITGGCWDLFDTRARRAVVKIICSNKSLAILPGISVLHPSPWREATLRLEAVAGETELRLQDEVLRAQTYGATPKKVLLNPEGELLQHSDPPLLAEFSTFDAPSRIITLDGPLPVGVRFAQGTKVRWLYHRTGLVLDAQNQGATELVCECRWENPYGVWIVDEGGGAEQKVMVLGSTYQKRRLASEVELNDTIIYLDRPLRPLDWGFTNKLVFSNSAGGVLGEATIAAFTPGSRQVTVTAPVAFGILLTQPVTVEVVRGQADFGCKLEIMPLPLDLISGESFQEFLGLTAGQFEPTWASHQVHGDWPPTVLGQWPGMHVYDPNERTLSNAQETGTAMIEVDRGDLANDVRVYLAAVMVLSEYDPVSSPSSPLGNQTVPGLGTFATTELNVTDASVFPSQSVINNWIANTNGINPTGAPPRIVVGSEGDFGRTPVYLWGRGAAGTDKENVLYVSGISRRHRGGVRVASYLDFLPVSGAVGIWGGNPGLETAPTTGQGHMLLDYGSANLESLAYTRIDTQTPTRAHLFFERGFVPEFSHNPSRTNPLDATETMPIKLVKADKWSVPLRNGYSWPFYLGGGMVLQRLRTLVDLGRAAGVKVIFVNAKDQIIPI